MVKNLEKHRVNVQSETKAVLTDANQIARAQLLRYRNRLGTLTHDQEQQIEDLLISTVTKISLVSRGVIRALANNSSMKEAAINQSNSVCPPDDLE